MNLIPRCNEFAKPICYKSLHPTPIPMTVISKAVETSVLWDSTVHADRTPIEVWEAPVHDDWEPIKIWVQDDETWTTEQKHPQLLKSTRRSLKPKLREKEKDHQDKIKNESDGQYMNIDGLASYIKRTKGAIRNLVMRGAIPYRKQAGRLIFLKGEIDEWYQTAPGETLDEIKREMI